MVKQKKRNFPYISFRNLVFLSGLILVVFLSSARTFSLSWATNEWLLLCLVLLGLVLGALHLNKISDRFLIGVIAIALMSLADLKKLDLILFPVGTFFDVLISYIIFFLAPATLIIAIKEVWFFFNSE